MKVECITITSQDAEEANVIVTDGHYRCEAFSQPCLLQIGQILSEPLHSLSEHGLVRSENTEDLIEVVPGSLFGRRIIGIIDSLSRKTIRVGNLVFSVHYIPGDLVEGERVEFFSDRIDIIE